MSTEQPTILIELAPRPGLQQVARLSTQDLAELSARALDSAMSTIQHMAERIGVMADNLAGNSDEVEIEYGIKIDFEGQAIIAKAGAEAAINVTLTWKRKESDDA